MAQIWEYIKIALMNIKSNKGRSILTMLGIIIGIASVILIISIGNGMRSEINNELESMAGGQVALYTNDSVEGNDVVFTDEDFELVQEKVEHVKGVTPQYSMWANAEGKKAISRRSCMPVTRRWNTVRLRNRWPEEDILPRAIICRRTRCV